MSTWRDALRSRSAGFRQIAVMYAGALLLAAAGGGLWSALTDASFRSRAG